MVWRSKHCLTQEKVQAYSAVLHFYQINSCLLYCAVSVADYSAHVSICVLMCTVNFHFSPIPSPLLYPTWRPETGIWFTLAWPSQLLTWSIFGFCLAFQNLFGDYRRQARSLLTGFVCMLFKFLFGWILYYELLSFRCVWSFLYHDSCQVILHGFSVIAQGHHVNKIILYFVNIFTFC